MPFDRACHVCSLLTALHRPDAPGVGMRWSLGGPAMVELLDCTPAEGTPMTDDRLPLAELMAKADDGDFLRSVAESVLQILMEADVEGVIGAARYERSGERATYRNGYRERALDTRLGTLNLKIPKLRTGSLLPRLPRAAAHGREGARRGDPGGLDCRRQHPTGRRSGPGDGPERHLEVLGVQALQGHRRAGERASCSVRSPGNGRICGSMPLTSKCGKAAASSRWPS